MLICPDFYFDNKASCLKKLNEIKKTMMNKYFNNQVVNDFYV